MRVITTWMYFEASQIKGDWSRRFNRHGRGDDIEPGIGIAWYAGDTASLMPISNLKIFRELPVQEQGFSERILHGYIDAFLTDDEDDFVFERSERPIRNPVIVDFVFGEPFVIERSPPIHLNLKGVLTNTNLPVWIGTYMGWSVAPEHSVLLFFTVPGGIIVVSSAMGLASALSSGLSTSVKRLFRKA